MKGARKLKIRVLEWWPVLFALVVRTHVRIKRNAISSYSVYSKAKYRKAKKLGIFMDWTNRLYISVLFKFIWSHNPFNDEI
jgi:hypothetical protein